jgi:hypothetical protein
VIKNESFSARVKLMNDPIKFVIVLQSPIALSAKLQKGIHFSDVPKFRIVKVDIRREGEDPSIFRLTCLIHPDDIHPEQTHPDEFRTFRDQLVSLLAVSAMVPIRLLSNGSFTFHLGERHYKIASLGPSKLEGPPAFLGSVAPLIAGQFLSERRSAAVYFIFQAINSDQPLYRFINIAMCLDLITADDTSEPNTVNPVCSECGYILKQCPDCQKSWTIPNTFRNKARFLVGNEQLLSQFISVRNRVFHGSAKLGDDRFRQDLRNINVPLLVILRNYIGKELGLNPISEKDLHWALEDLRIEMSVYYTTPEKED